MAENLVFDYRVIPADLIPSELLKLSVEDQIERFANFMADLRDFADIQTQAAQTGNFTLLAPDTPAVYANAPAGPAEWAGQAYWRVAADLSRFTECRLSAAVATVGAAGCELAIQAAPAASFDFLDGADGPKIALDALGLGISDWRPIASGYRTDVVLRIVESAGDGAADPAIGTVMVQCR